MPALPHLAVATAVLCSPIRIKDTVSGSSNCETALHYMHDWPMLLSYNAMIAPPQACKSRLSCFLISYQAFPHRFGWKKEHDKNARDISQVISCRRNMVEVVCWGMQASKPSWSNIATTYFICFKTWVLYVGVCRHPNSRRVTYRQHMSFDLKHGFTMFGNVSHYWRI